MMDLDYLTTAFQALEQEKKHQEGTVFQSIRKNAFQEFLKKGIPNAKNENWKYTPAQKFFVQEKIINETSNSTSKIQLQTFPFIKSNRLVFINGKWSEQYSHIIDKNIKIENLKSNLSKSNFIFTEYFDQIAPAHHDSLTALNTAFFEEGLFIHVPKNTKVEHPILLIHYISEEVHSEIIHHRNFIYIDKSSEAVLIESYQNESQAQCVLNQVNEILIQDNAKLDCYQININEKESKFIGTTAVQQNKHSRLNHYAINIGGKLIRNNTQAILKGSGAEADLNGIYVLQHNDHVDNHILVHHAVPECVSHQLYKGLIDDSATAVFNGKIYVQKDAQKTNAFQTNKNILLSNKATVNTMPQLEIFADDVKCSHGATVGQIDKNAMFYLKSRGLNENTALRILFQAFVGEVLEKIKIEPLKNFLLEELHTKFEE